MSEKRVYFFGDGKAEGSADMRDLLGGKGANLAEMTNIGIPVPPGFTISTEVCMAYYQNDGQYPEGLEKEVEENLRKVEEVMGARFGDGDNPLLVSVRSGARVSMPGMMDTVLNLGLNDSTVQGLIKQTNDERMAYDSYRRFVQTYGNVILKIKGEKFETILEDKKKRKGVKLDTELDAEDLKGLVAEFKALVKEETGQNFPADPMEQLWRAIGAVFGSWNNPRAMSYRRLYGIPDRWGTAVNVQAMVFGNMGDDSATGVAFTRDPATGEPRFYGEYLVNAQGEDVVAGIRTPQPINIAGKTNDCLPSLEEQMPEIYRELEEIYQKLESHYRDMQDIEFTIQRGRLWMLQTRRGKRAAAATVRVAVDMAKEGLISKEEALLRVEPEQLDQLLHPMLDPNVEVRELAKGLPASPGAASGAVVFSADEAAEKGGVGGKVILVRLETSPDDVHGMASAQGVLTARGGMTSHAAVVARGMGKSCVAGCGAIEIDYEAKRFMVKDTVVREGDWITLDGATGRVILGAIPTIEPRLSGDFQTLMEWADEVRRLGVRTNADTPHDARVARDFGAEGIGLCRTEHMFFEGDRIDTFQQMILAEDREGREQALAELLPMQKDDFVGIFKAMDGLPVTIRTLDPPLHEFLPGSPEEIARLAEKLGISKEALQPKLEELHEANPMLGHRGCRLGIVYPEITCMQARAIFEAACEVIKEGYQVFPEVMIPLVGEAKELRLQREIVDAVAREAMEKHGVEIEYLVGTMIELPRAALTADEVAKEAQFFSFGTNDLTQTTFGLSRDDAGRFLPLYLKMGILDKDPFQSLDQVGVGQLMEIGIEKGKGGRPDLKVGICGEHGGEPSSVEFCHRVGMNYVSCSPYRVPIARLAAAQAVLKEEANLTR